MQYGAARALCWAGAARGRRRREEMRGGLAATAAPAGRGAPWEERDESDRHEMARGGAGERRGVGRRGKPARGASQGLVLQTRDQGSRRACPARMHVCIWRVASRPRGWRAGEGCSQRRRAAAAPNTARHTHPPAPGQPSRRGRRGGDGVGTNGVGWGGHGGSMGRVGQAYCACGCVRIAVRVQQ